MEIAGLVLDVNETLFSLDPLATRFEAAGLDAADVDVWFGRVLRDGFALAATDTVAEFPSIGRHHLGQLMRSRGLDPTAGTIAEMLGGFEEVSPHRDVRGGLEAARAAGLSTLTLTNGTARVTRDFLERHDLADLIDETLEAGASGVWKPHARAYRWAAAQAGRAPGQLILIAVHPWDVHGAACAGLVAGWLDRDGASYPDHFRAPDVRGATLEALVRASTTEPRPDHEIARSVVRVRGSRVCGELGGVSAHTPNERRRSSKEYRGWGGHRARMRFRR